MCEEKIAMPTDPRFQDLLGERFGRLVVVAYAGKQGKKHRWKCLCDCGSSTTVQGWSLKGEDTKSCGCLQRELTADRATTHGKSYSKLYKNWSDIRTRCTNPHHRYYSRYRGLLSEEFADFEKFAAYVDEELGLQPEGTSFDRIDNEKGYERGNIRYATAKQQNRNTRRNIMVEINGESMLLIEAVERFSELNYKLVYNRISHLKWAVGEALTTPLQRKPSR